MIEHVSMKFFFFLLPLSTLFILNLNSANASLCEMSLLPDFKFLDIQRQRLSFQEYSRNTINIPDRETKKEILQQLNIEMDDVLLDIGYLQDKDKQIQLLQQRGYTLTQINLLRDHKILEFDLLEYQYLTTRPPIHTPNIRLGVRVSISNEDGYLENAIIIEFKEEVIVVQQIKQGRTIFKEVRKEDIYQPISQNQEVIYITKDGYPIRTKISSVGDSGEDGVILDFNSQEIIVSQLKIKPRKSIRTGGVDLSKSIIRKIISIVKRFKFNNTFHKLIKLYQDNKIKEFISLNNAFMRDIQKEMKKQGISTSLFYSQSSDYEDAFNLRMQGVHPNGNKTAMQYMRILERHNALFFSLSIVDNLLIDAEGQFNPSYNGTGGRYRLYICIRYIAE